MSTKHIENEILNINNNNNNNNMNKIILRITPENPSKKYCLRYTDHYYYDYTSPNLNEIRIYLDLLGFNSSKPKIVSRLTGYGNKSVYYITFEK